MRRERLGITFFAFGIIFPGRAACQPTFYSTESECALNAGVACDPDARAYRQICPIREGETEPNQCPLDGCCKGPFRRRTDAANTTNTTAPSAPGETTGGGVIVLSVVAAAFALGAIGHCAYAYKKSHGSDRPGTEHAINTGAPPGLLTPLLDESRVDFGETHGLVSRPTEKPVEGGFAPPVVVLAILVLLTVSDGILQTILFYKYPDTYALFLNQGTAFVYILVSSSLLVARRIGRKQYNHTLPTPPWYVLVAIGMFNGLANFCQVRVCARVASVGLFGCTLGRGVICGCRP